MKSTINGTETSMTYRTSCDYRTLTREERATMIARMIGNSVALATLAGDMDVEAGDLLSGLSIIDHATGEGIEVPRRKSEMRFLDGAEVASPVLMAFSIELALKAIVAQEGQQPWFATHNLEFLYNQLTVDKRREIDRVPKRPNRSNLKGEQMTELGSFEAVEATLRVHRNLFIEWGLCRKVPKRPHSGRRFGRGM